MPPLTPQARQRVRAQRAADLGSAAREDDPGLRRRRRLRRPGAPAARRALPDGLRLDVGPAGAAELLLQQPAPDRADAGLGDDPHRDGPRRARRPDERASICRRRSASGWAIRSAAGKATRWSSTRRTSPTRRASAAPRRTCTSSSGSRASTRRRCCTGSPIEDPDTWTKPWTGEYTWPATDELMYEYACHEGNYAMGNILRGARLKEAQRGAEENQQGS